MIYIFIHIVPLNTCSNTVYTHVCMYKLIFVYIYMYVKSAIISRISSANKVKSLIVETVNLLLYHLIGNVSSVDETKHVYNLLFSGYS